MEVLLKKHKINKPATTTTTSITSIEDTSEILGKPVSDDMLYEEDHNLFYPGEIVAVLINHNIENKDDKDHQDDKEDRDEKTGRDEVEIVLGRVQTTNSSFSYLNGEYIIATSTSRTVKTNSDKIFKLKMF
eukprot:TRINITY_DN3287_c0_g1_i6.p1 TRINITY_DN3287_c0_g1~~TRINITY_DN3287_c0_g1_i6.p1  ORF type:complete len:131 (-),score=30.17 TRINITY_DN3287_c0_g1_i6:30-422(-)